MIEKILDNSLVHTSLPRSIDIFMVYIIQPILISLSSSEYAFFKRKSEFYLPPIPPV